MKLNLTTIIVAVISLVGTITVAYMQSRNEDAVKDYLNNTATVDLDKSLNEIENKLMEKIKDLSIELAEIKGKLSIMERFTEIKRMKIDKPKKEKPEPEPMLAPIVDSAKKKRKSRIRKFEQKAAE